MTCCATPARPHPVARHPGDAASGLIDLDRIAGMLRRVKGRIVHMVLSRVSPLAVPVLLEIGERAFGRCRRRGLLAEAEAIIAEATGDADLPPAFSGPAGASRQYCTTTRPGSRILFGETGDLAPPYTLHRRATDARSGGSLYWPAAPGCWSSLICAWRKALPSLVGAGCCRRSIQKLPSIG